MKRRACVPARMAASGLACLVLVASAHGCTESEKLPSDPGPPDPPAEPVLVKRPLGDYRLYVVANPVGDPLEVSMKEIFAVRGDGSALLRITDSSVDINVPAFTISPDGRRLAYEGEFEPGCGRRPPSRPCGPGEQPSYAMDIMVIGTDGSDRTRVTDVLASHPAPRTAFYSDPQWSPDGARLAFAALLPDTWELRVIELSSGVERTITSGPLSWKPRWSPGGDQIAHLVQSSANTWQLGTVAATGGVRSLVSTLPLAGSPSWSPDGIELAVSIAWATTPPDVELIRADGRNRRSISGSLANAVNAVWEPGGRRVVFQADQDGGAAIFRVDLPDGEPRRLTDLPVGYRAQLPVVSSDGEVVAFIATPPVGLTELWIVRMDGTDLTRIPAPGPLFQVAFDPRVPASR